jgi:DNA-directed RNA polymerase specialized sigma subunit
MEEINGYEDTDLETFIGYIQPRTEEDLLSLLIQNKDLKTSLAKLKQHEQQIANLLYTQKRLLRRDNRN